MKSPWLADAAVGATMRDYPIRTVADFLNVPEDRRCICLREFHSWLHMQEAVPALFVACGLPREAIHMAEAECFIWKDDGQAAISISIREMGAPEGQPE